MIEEQLQLSLRERFNPDGSQLRQIQLRQLDILLFIDRVCKENRIPYWLSSGTLIGAVRHGGFIPWDDDVDIEMMDKDYKRFCRVLYKKNNERFVLQNHKTDSDYYAPYGKVRDTHSCIKEINSNDLWYRYKGLYVDVFRLQKSSSKSISVFTGKIHYIMLFRMSRIKIKWIRKVLQHINYFILSFFIYPILSFFTGLGSKRTLRHTLGSGFAKPRDINDLFPLTTVVFEGHQFPAPNNTDAYLRKIYGDYHKLPDLQSVDVHIKHVDIW